MNHNLRNHNNNFNLSNFNVKNDNLKIKTCTDCNYNIFNLYKAGFLDKQTIDTIIGASPNSDQYKTFNFMLNESPIGLRNAYKTLPSFLHPTYKIKK